MHSTLLRPLSVLVCLSLPACILVTEDDNGADTASTLTGGPSSAGPTGQDPTPNPETTGASATTSDGTATSGDTGPLLECGDNEIADPGFEGGAPNPAWNESSIVFDTVLCDDACTTDEGAAPYEGSWWVWFGGSDVEPDTASVSQMFTVNASYAEATFFFQINTAAGTSDDVFSVEIDGTTVFMVTDGDVGDYGGYTQVVLALDEYADGQQHRIAFNSVTTGAGLTNFFLDAVELVGCEDPMMGTGDPETSGSMGSTGTGEGSSGDMSTTGGSTTGGETDGTTA